MDKTASRSLRGRLIAVASFAYAFSYLYTTGFYVWGNIQRWGWESGSWAIAAYLLAAVYAFGQFFGFVVVGGAFLGTASSRARGVRMGAYWIGVAYLLACAATLMRYGYAYTSETFGWRIHAVVIATSLLYLAGAATAFVVARAYATESADRKRVLGWASVWLGAHAGLAVLAGFLAVILSGLGADAALCIAAHTSLLLGALAATLAFFGYRRSPGWVGEVRYASLVLVSASAVALYAVLLFTRNLIDNLHYLPSYWDSWLALLAGIAQMVAGVCLCLAFVVAYRDVPRPVKSESSEGREVVSPECPTCGTPYDPADYREDARVWLCVSCGGNLRLVDQASAVRPPFGGC